jgi:hypothetical protein
MVLCVDHMQVEMTPRAQAAMANIKGGQFNVTPENVLGMYAVVLEQVTRLQASLAHFKRQYGEGMPLLGNGHPVSKPFKESFDASTAKLVDLCQGDINNLREVANGFADAARAYGKTEEDIQASFDPSTYRYVPTPVPGTIPLALRAATDPMSVGSPPSTMSGLFSGGNR